MQFQRLGIVGRLGSESVQATLARLADWLVSQPVAFRFDDRLHSEFPGSRVEFATTAELGDWADLIIVVGGDGTLLTAARDLAGFEKPLLGINRGRLGFLTDIMPDELEAHVGAVLSGRYVLEHRFLLEAEVLGRKDGAIMTALNDVVLHTGQSIRMIEFDLYVDNAFVYRQRSDGLIVSTPTGSTAYALSAGGPIMQPGLDAMALVPMFPHSLSSRPLMIDGNSTVEIGLLADPTSSPSIACDAQAHTALEPGERVRIRKHPHRLHLLHPEAHNYYQICRTKLGWGSRPGADPDELD